MRTPIRSASIASILSLCASAFAGAPAHWHSMGGAAGMIETHDDDEGSVEHLIEIGTGRNSRLVAIGWFAVAGRTPAPNGAQWDVQSWSPLPQDCVLDHSAGLRVGSKVLIGAAQSIKIWDGVSCDVFEDDVDGIIYAVGFFGNKLVAAGQFTSIGGVAANSVAIWNGSTWMPLGLGVNGSRTISSVVEYDGKLIVAGDFENIGGVAAHRIAQWDGSTWSPLGTGVQGFVYHLAVYNNRLIVCGYLTGAGGVHAMGVAQWDGAAWLTVGAGIPAGRVSALAEYQGRLIAGGSFTEAGSVLASDIAQWDGTNWSRVGNGVDGSVDALAVFEGELYAGGSFPTASGINSNSIAKWNGSAWSGVDGGVQALNQTYQQVRVAALGVLGQNLYVGGMFLQAGPHLSPFMAKWSADSQQPPIAADSHSCPAPKPR